MSQFQRIRRVVQLIVGALLLLGLSNTEIVRADPSSYPVPSATARWTMVSQLTKDAISAEVDVLIVPLFDASSGKPLDSRQIENLNARGITVLCSVIVGYWNVTDPDADDFTATMKGSSLWGDSNRRWLDIRNTGVWEIMESRFELAKQTGCSGVVGVYLQTFIENTGLPITGGDQLAYNRYLADAAHELGLSIGMYNTNYQADQLVSWYDFAVVESCLEAANCQDYVPFVTLKKPVFDIEYWSMNAELNICGATKDLGFNTIIKTEGNDVGFSSCLYPD
jgi:hypothetical protein